MLFMVEDSVMFPWLLVWQAVALSAMWIVFWHFKSKQRIHFHTTNRPTVFITGCDSGFGKQLALQLSSSPLSLSACGTKCNKEISGLTDCITRELGGQCQVIAGCLTEQGRAQLDALDNPSLHTVQLDVTNEDSVTQARERVEKLLNGEGLWGLVNNAGVASIPGATDWMDKQDIVGCLNVNIIGLMDVTRQFLPLVKKAKGRIVNVSSINGRFAFGNSIYCASKFAVEGFSDSIRRELASWGVHVAVMEPGFFQTSLTNNDGDRIVDSFLHRFNQLQTHNRPLYMAYGSKFAEKNVKVLREHLSKGRLNSNLRLVTNQMEHALFSKMPRTRYACGSDAKFFWIPLSMLPTAVSDWLIGLAMNKSCSPEGDLWAL